MGTPWFNNSTLGVTTMTLQEIKKALKEKLGVKFHRLSDVFFVKGVRGSKLTIADMNGNISKVEYTDEIARNSWIPMQFETRTEAWDA